MRRVKTVSAGVVNNGSGVSTDMPSTRGYPSGDLDTATVPSTTSANVTDDVNRVYRNSVVLLSEFGLHIRIVTGVSLFFSKPYISERDVRFFSLGGTVRDRNSGNDGF